MLPLALLATRTWCSQPRINNAYGIQEVMEQCHSVSWTELRHRQNCNMVTLLTAMTAAPSAMTTLVMHLFTSHFWTLCSQEVAPAALKTSGSFLHKHTSCWKPTSPSNRHSPIMMPHACSKLCPPLLQQAH